MDVSRAHAAAILALLDPLSYTVYPGEVTDPDEELVFPYLVVWTPPPTREDETEALVTISTSVQVTCSGQSPDEVLAALERAGALLHNATPTITGRQCRRIKQDPTPAPPPQRDPVLRTPAGRPAYFGWCRFTVASMPAGV